MHLALVSGKTIQPAISTSASLPSVHKIKSQFEMKILFARKKKRDVLVVWC